MSHVLQYLIKTSTDLSFLSRNKHLVEIIMSDIFFYIIHCLYQESLKLNIKNHQIFLFLVTCICSTNYKKIAIHVTKGDAF